MNGDKNYQLTNKQKAAGILVVCAVFLCITSFRLYREASAYSFTFSSREFEIKDARIEGGTISSDSGSDDFFCATNPILLPAGGYKVSITYSSGSDAFALVQGNNDCIFNIQLPVTYGEEQTITDETHFILPHGTDKARIKFYNTGDGPVKLIGVTISTDHHLYRDYYAYILIFALLCTIVIVIILGFNRLRITWVSLSYIGMLVIAFVLVSIPFFMSGTYYEVDTQAHLKRIEAIAQGLRDRQFPVIIGPNYANQYGELTALQPGLFLYIPALMRLMGVSVPMAYNIFMVLVNLATAVLTVICAEKLFKSLRWGMVAASLYLVEPFRLYVMLPLGAGAGMGVALVFLPFLITGLHETMDDNGKGWKYIAIGLWGLICSHVMGFALSFIAMFIYILFHLKNLRDKGVISGLIKAAVTFTLLSVGTLLPFAEYYFSDWNRTALQWTDFYHYPIELRRELFNIIVLLVLMIAYYGAKKTGQKNIFVRGAFVIGFISVLMATPYFPWALFGRIPAVDTFLSMMQYPFRFHFLATICISYTATVAICSNMDARTSIRRYVMYSIVILLGIGLLGNYYYFGKIKLFYGPLVGEINTTMEDYLPGGTLTEWYDNDTGEFSDYDLVQAYSYSKAYTHIDCTYTSAAEGQYMEFPLFYYKGYRAHDQNGRSLRVEKGEHNRVRVYLTKSDEIQELCLRYNVRPLYTYAFVFSLVFAGIWLSLNAFSYVKNRRHRVLKFD